ncbi:hypothetical protein ACFCXT_37365 [Streptomyces vinaceus]|uniref:hypothetical protein n=1 Tax=Streptomyces vinaceus TaxID=1960 RepID=UPI0035D8B637
MVLEFGGESVGFAGSERGPGVRAHHVLQRLAGYFAEQGHCRPSVGQRGER